MHPVAKALVVAGGALACAGLLLHLAQSLGLPVGRLPGDVLVRGGRGVLHVPVATCLVLSALATGALWLWNALK